MYFQGKTYTFDQLAAHRSKENLAAQCAPDEQERRHARCQAGVKAIADLYEQTRPDITVIIGNDQMEVFKPEHIPAFAIFWGDFVEGIPRTKEFLDKLPPGIAQAEFDRTPAAYIKYPTDAKLGKHLIEAVMSAEFDVAQMTHLPEGQIGSSAVPHAYGFIYRRVLRDKLVPTVPIFINTFYPPNQPTAGRCYDFGRAIGRAIKHWAADKTVDPPVAGHCHRYPPGIYINPETGVVVQKFPMTDQHHWCGEWDPDGERLLSAVRRSVRDQVVRQHSVAPPASQHRT